MRKFLTCFLAFWVCTSAAIAADVVASRAIPGAASGAKTSTERSIATRGKSENSQNDKVSDASARSAVSAGAASTSRTAVASRTVVAPNPTTSESADKSRAAASDVKSTSVRVSRGVMSGDMGTSARDKLDAAVNTVGRNARVTAASINNSPTVRRAGMSLRPSTAEVGGRATIAGTKIQTGSNIGQQSRSAQSRAATNTTSTRETISEAKERLEQTASLNKSCQEQYNDCMDQFCAVIDSNQKRCSCSANLSRYTKAESAVKDANTQLNDVAQRIRYVGLSADEIRAIMSATEAEEALSGTRDTTETRDMLSDIEKLIKDPTSTVGGTDTYSSLDLDLDFSSDITDLFNLDFLNNSSGSMTNLRGAELYSAAKKRCRTILSQCKSAGATEQQITANYDLAIDRDCLAYEQGLNKMNETLLSNVRSANLMLQKARLAVLQNKNQYDAKGCIAALDTCMRDDMVCGDDYLKCLDPTKKYIDENGEVVLGRNINTITNYMRNYNNAKVDSVFLGQSYVMQIDDARCSASTTGENAPSVGDNGACVVKYLLQKIGTGQKVTDNGLCRAVLDKCQRYTYDSGGNYKPYNDIVVNYIQRAMVNINAAQHSAISDYASSCVLDLATCYNQQVTQVNAWTTSASVNSIRNVMRGACRNVALTCAYAIFADDSASCGTTDKCIDSISDMFYQSLLCPDNSTYTSTKGTAGNNGYINEYCRCNTGYEPVGSQCLRTCDDGEKRNSYGVCTKVSSAEDTFIESCPANASPTKNKGTVGENGYVSDYCKCNDKYELIDGHCSPAVQCPLNSTRAETVTPGTLGHNGYVNQYCRCNLNYKPQNESCVSVNCPLHSSATQVSGIPPNFNYATEYCICDSEYTPSNGQCIANNTGGGDDNNNSGDNDDTSCPSNSQYVPNEGTPGTNAYVKKNCQCVANYAPVGGACVKFSCPDNADALQSSGTPGTDRYVTEYCRCKLNYHPENNQCVADSSSGDTGGDDTTSCPANSSKASTKGTAGVNDYITADCKCDDNYELFNNVCELSTSCPSNSQYIPVGGTPGKNAYVKKNCQCVASYAPVGGACVKFSCPDNANALQASGTPGTDRYVTEYCRCKLNYHPENNQCVADSSSSGDTGGDDTTSCPANSSKTTISGTVGKNGYVTANCRCNLNYAPSDTQCVAVTCPANAKAVQTSGTVGINSYVSEYCRCDTGYSPSGGKCVADSAGGDNGDSTSCPEKSSKTTVPGTVGRNGYVTTNCRCNLNYAPSGGKCVAFACPAYSEAVQTSGTDGTNGYISEYCRCFAGSKPNNGNCVPVNCPDNSEAVQASGTPGVDRYVSEYCKCDTNYSPSGGKCVADSAGGDNGDSTSCPEYSLKTMTAGTVGTDRYVTKYCQCLENYHPVYDSCLYEDPTGAANYLGLTDYGKLSFLGTTADCDKWISYNNAITALNNGYGANQFTYVKTLFVNKVNGQPDTISYVPAYCAIMVKDSNGIYYSLNALEGYRFSKAGTDGYSNVNSYNISSLSLIDSNSKYAYANEMRPSVDLASGYPKLIVGNQEKHSIPLAADRTSFGLVYPSTIAPMVQLMQRRNPNCTFTGAYAYGGDPQCYDANGVNTSPVTDDVYMKWTCTE